MKKFIYRRNLVLSLGLIAYSVVSFAQNNNDSTVTTQNDTILKQTMNKAQNQTGTYNSKVSNPFTFCIAPKPGKGNPLRVVWDEICPSSKAQQTPSPIPLPTPNINQVPDHKQILTQLNAPEELSSGIVDNSRMNKEPMRTTNNLGYTVQR